MIEECARKLKPGETLKVLLARVGKSGLAEYDPIIITRNQNGEISYDKPE